MLNIFNYIIRGGIARWWVKPFLVCDTMGDNVEIQTYSFSEKVSLEQRVTFELIYVYFVYHIYCSYIGYLQNSGFTLLEFQAPVKIHKHTCYRPANTAVA